MLENRESSIMSTLDTSGVVEEYFRTRSIILIRQYHMYDVASSCALQLVILLDMYVVLFLVWLVVRSGVVAYPYFRLPKSPDVRLSLAASAIPVGVRTCKQPRTTPCASMTEIDVNA